MPKSLLKELEMDLELIPLDRYYVCRRVAHGRVTYKIVDRATRCPIPGFNAYKRYEPAMASCIQMNEEMVKGNPHN